MSDPEYSDLESDFGEIMGILRQGRVDLPEERPSEAVWAAIATELDGSADTALNRRPSPQSVPAISDDGVGPVEDAPDPAVADERGDGSEVRHISSAPSWGRRAAILTAAAAAVVLVGVPLYLANADGDPAGKRADLAALDGFDGAGVAELDDHTLNIELDGIEPQDGAFYELWLLDADGEDVHDLRSLGRVEAGGSFVVPDDVDLERFTVVDVSIEPDDGNPDHSGASVLRGGLADA